MHDGDSDRDRELDAALAAYADVEPRAGLEQRVLANLRAERQVHAVRVWRPWPALVALAVAVLIAVVCASWRTRNKAFNPLTASGGASREDDSRAAAAAQRDIGRPLLESKRSQERVQSSGHGIGPEPNHLAAHELPQTETAAEAAPKLERFPAPEPLSEQEKLLLRFVQDDPQEAALVAAARAEQLQREDEEMKGFGEGAERVQQQ